MEIMSEKMVKQDHLIIAALVSLVVGFLIGVIFSSIQSTNGPAQVAQQQAPAQGQQSGGITPEQASQILAFESAVAADPQNLQAWTNLGHLYYDTSRFSKAIKAYNKSLELDPNNADVWTDLGTMYRSNKQPNEAISAFDRAISLVPTHANARFNKGVVLIYDLNDKAGGRKAWEELLAINPAATAPNGQSVKDVLAAIE
jgi:cytochrome c-type biogenesis protein CcmH/NrfG